MIKSRLLLSLAAAALLSPVALYFVDRIGLFDDGPIILPVVEDCSLHVEPCFIELPPGGRMRLDINPRRPSPSDSLNIVASFEAVEPESVGIRFKGVDMNMGYLENFVFEMKQGASADGSREFEGEAGVFACSVSLMEWLVLVRVRYGSAYYEVPFRFETRQKG